MPQAEMLVCSGSASSKRKCDVPLVCGSIDVGISVRLVSCVRPSVSPPSSWFQRCQDQTYYDLVQPSALHSYFLSSILTTLLFFLGFESSWSVSRSSILVSGSRSWWRIDNGSSNSGCALMTAWGAGSLCVRPVCSQTKSMQCVVVDEVVSFASDCLCDRAGDKSDMRFRKMVLVGSAC